MEGFLITNNNNNNVFIYRTIKFTILYAPANRYNANLGRTKLYIKAISNYITKKKRNTITYRKKHLTYKFKYRDVVF